MIERIRSGVRRCVEWFRALRASEDECEICREEGEHMAHGRGDPENPNYVTITQFGRADYCVAFMTWDEDEQDYVIAELAGCCDDVEVAEQSAKEWAAEEGVEVK